MRDRISHGDSRPPKIKAIINEVDKIRGVRNNIGNEIQVNEETLVANCCINFERQNRQQNK